MNSTFVFLLYISFTALLYHRTFGFIFRSDEWILYNPFIDLDFSLKSIWKVIAFEMFGDIRFFPLSHLLLFLQFKLFGTRTVLYKITAVLLHSLTAFLLFENLRLFGVDERLSLLSGLLFLALFTHFDAVTWTYHIYHVLFSTLAILLSLYLVKEAGLNSNPDSALWALVVCGAAMFLYEAIVPLLFFMFLFAVYELTSRMDFQNVGTDITLLPVITILLYLCYGASYLIFFKREKKISGSISDYMSIREVFFYKRIKDGLRGLLHNFKIFLHNSGLPVLPRIADIVYLPYSIDFRENGLKRTIWFAYLLIILSGLIHLNLSREIIPVLIFLEISALSYIFLFIIGRNIKYAVTQPRYQYFFNAAQVMVLALLFCRESGQSQFAVYHLSGILLLLIFTNSLNVLKSNAEIARTLKDMHKTFWALKGFFRRHKNKYVYVDISTTPSGENGKFFLGSDIALDVLFHNNKRLIKNVAKADVIYDRNGLRNNSDKLTHPLDFTLCFAFLLSGNVLTKRQRICGSIKNGFAVYVNTDFHLSLESESFTCRSRDALLQGMGWHDIIIEKEDGIISIARNGIIMEQISLGDQEIIYTYSRDCLGDFYFGPRAPYYLTSRHICLGNARYRLKDGKVGNSLPFGYEDKHEWWPNEWLAEIKEINQIIDKYIDPEKYIPPCYAESLYKLASFTEKQKDYSRALSYFKILKKMAGNPTLTGKLIRADIFSLLPGVYYHMGAINAELGNFEESALSFFKCLLKEPSHKAAISYIFDTLMKKDLAPQTLFNKVMERMECAESKKISYIRDCARILSSGKNSAVECASSTDAYLKQTARRVMINNGINLLYKAASFLESKNQLKSAGYIFENLLLKIENMKLFDDKDRIKVGCFFHLGTLTKLENNIPAAKNYLTQCLKLNPNHMMAARMLREIQGGGLKKQFAACGCAVGKEVGHD
jgi:tetratricopeptide (TPR) repeat protein